jgi:gluconolactonase
VLFQQGDRRVAAMEAPLSSPRDNFVTLAGEYDGKRLNSPNDGAFRSDGSLYFTDPPYGLEKVMADDRKELPFQGIYRLGPGGDLHLLDDTVSFPNGIALSTDEKTLYVAVSDKTWPVWLAYDVLPDGDVENRRVFYNAIDSVSAEPDNGVPDGMAVHSSGTIFATGPGGVWVFSPDGHVLAKILTGRQTANCTLSADEHTLFITAHDTLMTFTLR